MPLPISGHELTDAEIAAVLRDSIAGAGRYPRHVELSFVTLCARHILNDLRLAGLVVIRPAPHRLTD